MNKLDEKAVEIGHEVFSIYFMLLKELKFKYDKCYSNPHIQLSKYFEKEIQEGEISDVSSQ